MHRPTLCCHLSFYLEQGQKDQTLDHMVIKALIPCHKPATPKLKLLEESTGMVFISNIHLNGFHLKVSVQLKQEVKYGYAVLSEKTKNLIFMT